MDFNNSKTVPRESTPPPPYTESPGIYPASLIYSNDHTFQQQHFAPESIIIESTLGPKPVHMFCPTCHIYIITETDKSPSNEAYLCCTLIFIVGCTICSCLPFFMKSFQKVDHRCPQCASYLGTYRP